MKVGNQLRNMYIISILICVALFISGCLASNQKEDTALTEADVEEYIQHKDMKPMAVEQLTNMTVMLFEDGIYYVSKNEEDQIKETMTYINQHSDNKITVAMEDIGSPHVYLMIHDNDLRKKAEKIQVDFIDGNSLEQTVKDEEGFIFFYNKNEEDAEVEQELILYMYDENEDLIHEEVL